MEYYVIGDIHGMFGLLKERLMDWRAGEILVLLGDYIDRGPDSLRVVQLLMSLEEYYPADTVFLMGNHEQMFLEFLKEPFFERDLYLPQGGYQTIESFLGHSQMEVSVMAERIQKEFPEVVSFIENLDNYHQGDNQWVFVHAGVDLSLDDWKDSQTSDFLWMREPFFFHPNFTGKKFVFGHTPTSYLNKDKSTDIWYSDDRSRIGIDGGAVFSGVLHGLHLSYEN